MQNTNHFVLFSNIKGGVGKSCLCTVFAHYLKSKGENLVVVDADSQRTVVRMRERDLKNNPEVTTPPWNVISVFDYANGDVTKIIPTLKNQKGWILVDCPGNMEVDRLIPLFEAADFVVVPLSYEATDVDAALNLFVPVFKIKNNKAKFIFVPNRINETARKGIEELRAERNKIKSQLLEYGDVTARIKQSVVLEPHRYNTINSLDTYQYKAVEHAFDKMKELIENE